MHLTDGDHLSLVLKHTRLESDWTSYRSGDRQGREAMILSTPELAEVRDVFASPYLAYAVEPGEIALLMHDLAPNLLPDVREPIATTTEDALLSRLARLHACYWDGANAPLALPTCALWVVAGPSFDRRRPPTRRRRHRFASAWCRVGGKHSRDSRRTWRVAFGAPATLDLGWYLAVNASRLARPKEAVIERYRALLEEALGRPIAASEWSQMVESAVLFGALMLLWSKALALKDDRPAARAEWEW